MYSFMKKNKFDMNYAFHVWFYTPDKKSRVIRNNTLEKKIIASK